jgi:hypothetical protein
LHLDRLVLDATAGKTKRPRVVMNMSGDQLDLRKANLLLVEDRVEEASIRAAARAFQAGLDGGMFSGDM